MMQIGDLQGGEGVLFWGGRPLTPLFLSLGFENKKQSACPSPPKNEAFEFQMAGRYLSYQVPLGQHIRKDSTNAD